LKGRKRNYSKEETTHRLWKIFTGIFQVEKTQVPVELMEKDRRCYQLIKINYESYQIKRETKGILRKARRNVMFHEVKKPLYTYR